MARAARADLLVDSVEQAGEEMRGILGGRGGPRADMALVNAGAGLYVAGQADSVADGYRLAADTVASGKAAEKLQALVDLTNTDA